MQTCNEKQGLEAGALREFASSLHALLGPGRFAFCELRTPPEPDGLCLLDGVPLYVEVAHLYGTRADTKALLGRRGKAAPTHEQKRMSALIPLDERLVVPLNNVLARKAIKRYQAPRTWLLIRSAFPLWNLDDFKRHKERIVVPENHSFEQIWLLCGPRSTSGVLRIA